jgi:8-oxo-dGTP diphosphatase
MDISRLDDPCSNAIVPELTTVVAAVIRRRGQILICRRKPDQPHPLKWEFPGGKVEPGEDPPAALARELLEELGIATTAALEIERRDFCYPDQRPIRLIFYEVIAFTGEPQNRIFAEIRWADPPRLTEFDFLEGDLEFVQKLAASHAG